MRMRGMGGGYANCCWSIASACHRASPRWTIWQPDQVERIEIMRAPTAEYGARAVAGTINIVPGKPSNAASTNSRLGTQWEEGRSSPNLSWTRNDKQARPWPTPSRLAPTTTAPATKTKARTRYTSGRWHHRLGTAEFGYSSGERDAVHLNGRIQATLGRGESLNYAVLHVGTGFYAWASPARPATRQQRCHSPTPTLSPTAVAGQLQPGQSAVAKPWAKAWVEVRGGAGVGNFESHGLRSEFDSAGLLTRTLDDTTNTRETAGH